MFDPVVSEHPASCISDNSMKLPSNFQCLFNNTVWRVNLTGC